MKIRKITIKDEEQSSSPYWVGSLGLHAPLPSVPKCVAQWCEVSSCPDVVTPNNNYPIILRVVAPKMINVAGALALAHSSLVSF